MRNVSMIAAVGTGVGVIGLLSLPSISSLALQLSKREPKEDLYEDADGKSTPESVKAYSAKWPKAAILALAFIGCATAIAVAVLTTLHSSQHELSLENWLSAAAWVLILFQAVAIASSRKSVQAYSLGIHSFLSCIILAVILLVQDTRILETLLHQDPALFALRIIDVAVVFLLAFASVSIPRRPDVYNENGQRIDPMYTVSAFSRFNFGWPKDVLDLARKKKNLDMADLPRPDHFTRAKDVTKDWRKRNPDHPLWLSIILAHKMAFALQWVLTLGTAILNFAPQWVILQLLRILESRGGGGTYDAQVWMWVVWLGLVIIVQNFVESYTFWLSWAELTIPIRAQLSSLIFEKSMRRKDVKGTGKSSNKKAQEEPVEATDPTVAGPAGESTATDRPEVPDEEVDDEAALKKTKQSTVNLIGVDAKRVSDFAAYQNLFPGSLFKLIVSLTFLVSLLGWKALLAGFSTMVAIMPVNIYFSKRYAEAQDRLMKVRDEKTEVVTEALQGIRQIKFSALEGEWENKVGSVRERELKCVWDVFMGDTMLLACWVTSPIMLSAVSLAVYAALTGSLTPSVAFVSLGVFKALEVTLSVVPELTTDLLDAWVSVKRIEEYLKSPEISKVAKPNDEVVFDSAAIAWPADEKLEDAERFVLRDVTVTFPKGELSVISGKTGTGKSLMLAAILGEVDILSGSIYVPEAPPMAERHDSKATKANWIIPNAIAYVAQIPWIENASIKDNITFGLPFDEERYKKTVEVCALKKDLEMLSDGESTEIGANGINLSGGQKWRVTLARAIYSRAGILVMDDIFSAVDAHVGRHIFEKCLNGELAAGRTRILVTHHVALCESKTKYLVELGDGRVLNAGLLSELQEDGTLQNIKSHEQTDDELREDEAITAVNSDDSTDGEDDAQNGVNGNTLKKVTSKSAADPRKFVEEEKREEGAVKRHIYGIYLKASGGVPFWTVCVFIFLLVESFRLGRSWWLRIWTGEYEEESMSAFHINASKEHSYSYSISLQQTPFHTQTAPNVGRHGLSFYLGVYVGLAVISSIITTFRFYYLYIGSVKASRKLFAKLNFVILRAPLRWLDTVPVGRILNRFTADFNIIDSQLANSVSFCGSSFLQLLGVIVAGFLVSPWIVLLAAVLLLFSLYFAIVYLNGARPVKRLESNTKSPVFEQFGSALSGVSTIRGFDKTQTYIERMYKKLDDYSTATWHLWLFNRWMGWRMALVGSMFSVFVSILILLTPGIDSALAGFALAFALEFANCIMWTVRLYANVELNMNAAERIIEYAELPTESLDGVNPPAAWPTAGRIEVDNLVVSYALDLPPVLKGLTFSVNSNERVGVIGRTGAGKSSLTLALFRFLEARSGSIHIDGLDISKIKLHDLRSRLAIIPQDPVLFSGTVRSNLDPFDRQTDAELRDSLQRVHLIGTSGTATPTQADPSPAGSISGKNANVFDDLTSPISEGGLNLSQGQRQLLCLARAIVSRPRVMVLDEATSAVDMHTDALIQRSIREEFTDATLLVIAHRLSTIADFDRILVLSDGMVAEYGSPRELWERGREGVFRGMCEESGEREKLRGIIFGEAPQ
ncbi:p-loop containing nucleoside triphosphate hydrolase protein [Pleurostoma richardsiae]|uniref:P-loop containing nucleoside triphosphate hydrolase protein n=1 Tax=Pleurostoma richardsiae TaxID=41990 RepID=A0AA38S0X8_9PEZI|nr:p-loop containing nucleoside triphosphate hydrolase protein [Pleurostoma richardsiae]